MIKINITKDFFGWAVSIADYEKHIEKVKLGFLSKKDAQDYADNYLINNQ